MLFIGNIIKQTTERIKDDFVIKFCSILEFAHSRLALLLAKFDDELKGKIEGGSKIQHFVLESSVIHMLILCKDCIVSVIFYIYITIPMRILSYIWNIAISVVCRRSKHARAGLSHVRSLIAIGENSDCLFY